MRKGPILPNQNIFSQFEFENAVLFSPRDHSEMVADAHACENNEAPPPSHTFSEFITYQTAMENDETRYKSRDN